MPGPLEPVSGKRECEADIILAETEEVQSGLVFGITERNAELRITFLSIDPQTPYSGEVGSSGSTCGSRAGPGSSGFDPGSGSRGRRLGSGSCITTPSAWWMWDMAPI